MAKKVYIPTTKDPNKRGYGQSIDKPKIKESDIQRDIKTFLQYRGWFVVKIHQSMGSYKGIADLYCLKNGLSVWVEVKTPKGRMSEHQERFKDDVEQNGGHYIVARGIDDVSNLQAEIEIREMEK